MNQTKDYQMREHRALVIEYMPKLTQAALMSTIHRDSEPFREVVEEYSEKAYEIQNAIIDPPLKIEREDIPF